MSSGKTHVASVRVIAYGSDTLYSGEIMLKGGQPKPPITDRFEFVYPFSFEDGKVTFAQEPLEDPGSLLSNKYTYAFVNHVLGVFRDDWSLVSEHFQEYDPPKGKDAGRYRGSWKNHLKGFSTEYYERMTSPEEGKRLLKAATQYNTSTSKWTNWTPQAESAQTTLL